MRIKAIFLFFLNDFKKSLCIFFKIIRIILFIMKIKLKKKKEDIKITLDTFTKVTSSNNFKNKISFEK